MMHAPQSSTDADAAKASRKTVITGFIQVGAVIGVLLAAILINRALMSGDRGPSRLSASAPPPTVALIRPAPQDVALRLEETGIVQVRATVGLAPQVSGRVVALSPNLAAGGTFEANDVLFEIDPTDTDLVLNQARADLATARATLEIERAEAETAIREWALVNPGVPTPPLVAREPQIAQAQATVAAAQAGLDTARTNRERTTFSMPFDGRVLSSQIEIGQTLIANQVYGEVYRRDGLEVVMPVPEADAARLRPAPGRAAVVTDLSLGTIHDGTVVREDAALDTATRMSSLIVEFDQPPPFLPGAFVNVAVTGDTLAGVYRLQADWVGAGNKVWTVRDGALQSVTAQVLGGRDGDVITPAFDVGDGLVTTPPPGARDGLPVLTLEDTTP